METAQRTITSVNPATLEALGEVPVATTEDVREAMSRARIAQRAWGKRPLKERAAVLHRAAEVTASRAEELARALVAENGKTLFEAYAAEVMSTAETFRWVGKFGPKYLGPERLKHASPLFKVKRSWLHFEPMGIIGIISPWNYPLAIPATEIAFALAAGNGVVLKPSEFTPLIAEKIREICIEAGVPEDLVQIVHGEGEVGAALVEAEPNKVLFTGSVATGRKVAAAAGERGIAVTLELGGKDAMLVRDDADIDRAVAGALFGSNFNAGQTCAAVERIYVDRAVAGEFTERLAERARGLRLGNPVEPDVDVGPMINEGQRDVVLEHVSDAEGKGAKVLAGGEVDVGLKGAFYAPAVLSDVPDEARLMREETFGPVVPIRVVDGDEEAVRLANDSEFGLTASVWTKDAKAGRALANELEAGTVFVNDILYSYASPDAPWGGVKSSGTGRTHSRYGLHELTNVKHVSVDPGWMPALGYPYTPELTDMVRSAMEATYAKGLRRVRALGRTISAARKAL